jgi:hypothetical protein
MNLGPSIPLSGFLMMFSKEKTIAKGAATTVYCILKSGLESETGRDFDDSTVTDLTDKWTDDDLNRFWEWTENVIREHTVSL